MKGLKKTAAALTTMAAMVTLSALLTACATSGQQATSASSRHEGANGKQQQLSFQLASGVYRCEFGQRVEMLRDARNLNLIELNWQGNRHTLQRYDSNSGLPRYEDRRNGLLWIELPWKSVLMDTSTGRPLATECKATAI